MTIRTMLAATVVASSDDVMASVCLSVVYDTLMLMPSNETRLLQLLLGPSIAAAAAAGGGDVRSMRAQQQHLLQLQPLTRSTLHH